MARIGPRGRRSSRRQTRSTARRRLPGTHRIGSARCAIARGGGACRVTRSRSANCTSGGKIKTHSTRCFLRGARRRPRTRCTRGRWASSRPVSICESRAARAPRRPWAWFAKPPSGARRACCIGRASASGQERRGCRAAGPTPSEWKCAANKLFPPEHLGIDWPMPCRSITAIVVDGRVDDHEITRDSACITASKYRMASPEYTRPHRRDVIRTAMCMYRPYMHPCVLPMHWQG